MGRANGVHYVPFFKGIFIFNLTKKPKYCLCFGIFFVFLDTIVGLDENTSNTFNVLTNEKEKNISPSPFIYSQMTGHL